MIRIFLFYFLIACVISMTLVFLDLMWGHRLSILLAKFLKFKKDDVENTTEKVEEILGEGDDESSKSQKEGKAGK